MHLISKGSIKKALQAAVEAIHFADSSDYKKALFVVVKQLAGKDCVSALMKSSSEVYQRICVEDTAYEPSLFNWNAVISIDDIPKDKWILVVGSLGEVWQVKWDNRLSCFYRPQEKPTLVTPVKWMPMPPKDFTNL